MSKQIKVKINGKESVAVEGMSLSEIIKGDKPCGGHGKCGKCKVRARGALSVPCETEIKTLSENELADGIRLACLTFALGDCEIETLDKFRPERILTSGEMPDFEIKPTFEKYGVAIDLGTTTLAARIYAESGNLLGEVSCINPQQEWGADVISRVEAALNGREGELSGSIRKAIDSIIKKLSETANISSSEIGRVVITGNTVMLSLLTEQNVEPFSHAPFNAKRLFGETLSASSLDVSSLAPTTPIYLPPCISAFVGADTICAILATQLCQKGTSMLVDIGTNGEMAIWHNEKLTVCSTAAGPAFEGGGISAGMRGTYGAIDKVSIQNGALYAHVIGNGQPEGICGSGLIDAVACMLDLEIIDESGYLEDGEAIVCGSVSLDQSDVRMLQLAKSAICAGLMTLIARANVDPSDVGVLLIAGGFGNYLNKRSAARIGLLPKDLAERSTVVGNVALSGACMLLMNSSCAEQAEKIAKAATVLEIATDPVFSDLYVSGMMFEKI